MIAAELDVLCVGGRQHASDTRRVCRVPVSIDDHHAQHAHRNDEYYLLIGQLHSRLNVAHRESAHGAVVRTQNAAAQKLAVPSL